MISPKKPQHENQKNPERPENGEGDAQPNAQASGGSGGGPGDKQSIATGNRDKPTARDVRLLNRLAKRKDWEIPEFAYKALPTEIALIAANKERSGADASYSTRARLIAATVLAKFNGQNQQNHPVKQEVDHRHLHGVVDMDEIIERLESLVEDKNAQVPPDNGDAAIGQA